MSAFDSRVDGAAPLAVDDESMWSHARRPPLSAEALHRIAASVKARHSGAGPRARWHVWVAASMLLLVGGVAGAGVATYVMKRPPAPAAPSERLGESSMVARARAPRAAPLEASPPPVPPAVAADERPSAPVEAPNNLRRGGAAAQRAATVVPPSPPVVAAPASSPLEPSPSGPAAEATMLRAALAALNRDRNPAAALSSLDRYDARFPSGMLRGEATLARARSLRELGRDDELLALLEHTSFDGVARGAELRVLRGELRMTRGRFAQALDDFQAVLAAGGPGSVQERALFGLASCRTRLGDEAGARAELRRFLEQFPASARAAEVRAALAR
jgi:hypothetical protein